jgi:exopolysaccharide biosynthesis protein
MIKGVFVLEKLSRTTRLPKFARYVGYVALAILYMFISTSLLLFHGPYKALTTYVIDSVATTRHGYLLRPLSLYTLSSAEIQAHSAHLMLTNTAAKTVRMRDYSNIQDNSIQIDTFTGSTFAAKVMLIRNPKLVKVAITKYVGTAGETVSEMVHDNGAVAGINAGAFDDTGWRGTGGLPLGITMHNGNLLQNDQTKWQGQPVVALTAEGQLICGAYSMQQLRAMNVEEAVSFGPVLVQDGHGMVQGQGGWGYAPRTAIGQKADGTIIFIVTDGRFIHGANDLGASLKDLQDLMLQYGAVTAANLDGGSSSTMVYNGKLVNQPTDILGERKVATSFVVTGK